MNLRKLFSHFCHQIPDRSYSFCARPLYVCSRCLGIYIGFLVSFPLFIGIHGFFKMGLRLFWVALFFVPMAIDGTTQLFGLRKSNNNLRFVSGYLAGVGTAMLEYVSFSILFFNEKISQYLPKVWSSILLIILMIPFYYILKRYNGKCNRFLEKFFNGVAFVSLMTMIIGIVILYAFAIGRAVAQYI